MVERVRIHLCGNFAFGIGDRQLEESLGRGQLRLLCAYLVLERDRPISRDELTLSIWPERAPAGHEGSLSALLSRLRAALAPEAALEGRSELRMVLPDNVWVDVEAAARAVDEAERELAIGNLRAAWSPANMALGVAGRGLLPGFDAPWVEARRRELDEIVLRALECLAQVGLGLRGTELAGAERAARALVERSPYREAGYRYQMKLHEARGDVAEALRTYERLRVLLREELGTTPAPELQAEHQRLLLLDGGSVPTPAPPASASQPPLPTALRMPRPIVGRVEQSRQADEAWAQALSGRGQMLVVSGEPGVGKTRFCAEAARRAHEAGAAVYYGRCDEDMLAPFQPFVEALSHHVTHTPAAVLRAQLAGRGHELGRLLPELHGMVPGTLEPLAGEAEAERYRLFTEAASLLGEAARISPVLLVLDDLHWADRATLLLLRHVCRALAGERVLILATHRTGEADPDGRLANLLFDLDREQLASRIPLGGLAAEEVAELIASRGGRDPGGFAESIQARTAGNPFFVEEVLRHLIESGAVIRRGDHWTAEKGAAEVGLPDRVREMIDRRLARVPAETTQALRAASVIGPQFSAELLGTLSGTPGPDLLDALDTAREAHLIADVPGARDRYTFVHALVRDALYDGLSPSRRAWLHRQTAAAIEQQHQGNLDRHLAALVHHCARATGADVASRLVDYALRAARAALSQFAYDEAASHFVTALSALDEAGGDERQRCEVLLELGPALGGAGRIAEARDTFLAAAQLATAPAASELLARAALGYAGFWIELGTVDEQRVELLEQALKAIGSADSTSRAELLAQLAVEVYYEGPQRRDSLSREAVRVARRTGDAKALARALTSRRIAIAGSADTATRLATSTALLQLARRAGTPKQELNGLAWHAVDLLDGGDFDAAYSDFDSYAALARHLRHPAYLWQIHLFAAMRAEFEGRLSEAEQEIATGGAIGARAEDPNAINYFGVLSFILRRDQGRLAELAPIVSAFVERYPKVPAWRCGLALLHAEIGDQDSARTQAASIVQDNCAALPADINWLPAMAWLATACALVRESDLAGRLYPLLLPHAERHVTTGYPIFCLGSVEHYLGLLAGASGHAAEAIAHFERALARNLAAGAGPALAQTRLEFARELIDADAAANRDRARKMLRLADDAAAAFGMRALQARIKATGAERGLLIASR